MLSTKLNILTFIICILGKGTSFSPTTFMNDRSVGLFRSSKLVPAKILSSKLVYDGNLKPGYRIEMINNSKISIIGFRLNIKLFNNVSRSSKCEFYVKKKQKISSKKRLMITGTVPEFEQICDYDKITAEINEVVFSDGTKLNALELILKSR